MKQKQKSWLANYIQKEYGNAPARGSDRSRPANKHQPTIDLINKILSSKDIPDNIRVDTLRVLACLLEENHPNAYVEKEFKKFLYREPDQSKQKKVEQKKKATGGWLIK
jgi:hypothetical protein